MLGWLRRVLHIARERRTTTRAVAVPPLSTTRPELIRTERAHRERLREADRVLDDFSEFDGALRLVVVRRK